MKASYKQLKVILVLGVKNLDSNFIISKLSKFPLLNNFLNLSNFLFFNFLDLNNF